MKKHLSRALLLVFVSLFLLSLYSAVLTQAATTWKIETVDSKGYVGFYTSLALDSSGNPHISYKDYTNYNLKYAKWTGTAWSIQTVDSKTVNVGSFTSLALDSSGNPHISYYDATNADLKYAKWTGSEWSIETVDSGIETVDSTGDVGWNTSLALDSSGNPHISYYDATNADLKYAKWTGTEWSIEPVDSTGGVGEYTSLALDSSNNPHISYYDDTNGDLKYAKWVSTGWSTVTVDLADDVGLYTSLALDSSGNPHISYYDNTNRDLKFASVEPTQTLSLGPEFINFLREHLLIIVGIIVVSAIAWAVWRRRK